MRSASKEFRRTMSQRRNFVNYADITLMDDVRPSYRTVLHLNPSNFRISGNTIHDDIVDGDAFTVGTAIGKSVTIAIDNTDEQFSAYNFYGAQVVLYVGLALDDDPPVDPPRVEKILIGYFTVITPASTGTVITIEAVDNMYKFDRPYSESQLTYPTSLMSIISDACSCCNVTNNTNIPSRPGYGTISPQQRPEGDITFRQVISYVAQILGVNAKIDATGALRFVWYTDTVPTTSDNDGGDFSRVYDQSGKYATGDNLDGGTFLYSNVDAITVTFDANCETESTYDKVTIYYENNGVYYKREFTGAFGGESFYLPTTKFWFTFHADSSITKWGWRISSIVPAQSGTVTGFSESSLPSESWTTVTYTSDMPESEHPYANGTSSAYCFDLDFAGATVDGGTFTENMTYHNLGSAKSVQISTDDIVITGVKVKNGDTSSLYGTEDYCILIEDNPLTVSLESSIASNLWTNTFSSFPHFRPFTLSFLQDPTIESGDWVLISDAKYNSYLTFCTSVEFTTGGYMGISCKAQSPAQQLSVYSSQSAKSIVREQRAANEIVGERISDYDLAVQRMNILSAQASGNYFQTITLQDGSTISYMSDKPLSVASDGTIRFTQGSHAWKITAQGFFSSTNASTTDVPSMWTQGIDANNNAVMNTVAAKGISFDWAHGGILTLGGQNNINGELTVKDANNIEIGHWGVDGLKSVLVTSEPDPDSGGMMTVQRGVKINGGRIEYVPPTNSSVDAYISMYASTDNRAYMSICNNGVADGELIIQNEFKVNNVTHRSTIDFWSIGEGSNRKLYSNLTMESDNVSMRTVRNTNCYVSIDRRGQIGIVSTWGISINAVDADLSISAETLNVYGTIYKNGSQAYSGWVQYSRAPDEYYNMYVDNGLIMSNERA